MLVEGNTQPHTQHCQSWGFYRTTPARFIWLCTFVRRLNVALKKKFEMLGGVMAYPRQPVWSRKLHGGH